MRKLLKKQGFVPKIVVTDKLHSSLLCCFMSGGTSPTSIS